MICLVLRWALPVQAEATSGGFHCECRISIIEPHLENLTSQFTAGGQHERQLGYCDGSFLAFIWAPRGAEWTLSKTGQWMSFVLLSVALFSGMHVSSWPNLPRRAPVQGQALGIHQPGMFPAPANSVSPAAVPWTSPGCRTFVGNVQSHFLRALVEGRVWGEGDRLASCPRPSSLLSLPKLEPQSRWVLGLVMTDSPTYSCIAESRMAQTCLAESTGRPRDIGTPEAPPLWQGVSTSCLEAFKHVMCC